MWQFGMKTVAQRAEDCPVCHGVVAQHGCTVCGLPRAGVVDFWNKKRNSRNKPLSLQGDTGNSFQVATGPTEPDAALPASERVETYPAEKSTKRRSS